MGAADLGRYRLKRVLGRGAMGEVWEAHDAELGRRVAVKIMHTTDDELALARTRFGREARVVAVLRHPNIVVVHDAGEVAGTCFMVMELVEGTPLRSLIGAPAIPLEDKVRWIRQIGQALAAMHEAGIVHRDVKPDNVIIRADGSACLVDFGIAKWARSEEAPTLKVGEVETSDDVIVGTPDYLPPETRYTGVFDERSDQHAWAVMAYELLAGVHPAEVAGRPLAHRADLPRAVVDAVERARAKLPKDRFESIDDALDALVIPTKSQEPSNDSSRPAKKTPPPPVGRPIPFAIGLVAVLAVGAIAVGLWSIVREPKRPNDEVPSTPSSSSSAAATMSPRLEDASPPVHGSDVSPGPSDKTNDAVIHGEAGVRPPRARVTVIAQFLTDGERDSLARLNGPAYDRCVAAIPGCPSKHFPIGVTCNLKADGSLGPCLAGPTGPTGAPGACWKLGDCLRDATKRPHGAPHDGGGYVMEVQFQVELR